MKPHEKERIEKAMIRLDKVILGIRATGGYKFRAQFKAPEGEINAFVESAETRLCVKVIAQVIAESMLSEPDCWGRNRLAEYRERLKDALMPPAKPAEAPPAPQVAEAAPQNAEGKAS